MASAGSSLAGKAILVTGASSGIGADVARPVGLESSKVRSAKLCVNQFEEITQTDNIGRDILGGRLHWWKYFPL